MLTGGSPGGGAGDSPGHYVPQQQVGKGQVQRQGPASEGSSMVQVPCTGSAWKAASRCQFAEGVTPPCHHLPSVLLFLVELFRAPICTQECPDLGTDRTDSLFPRLLSKLSVGSDKSPAPRENKSFPPHPPQAVQGQRC